MVARRQVRAAARERRSEIQDFLAALVNCNSFTHRPEGVAEVASQIVERLVGAAGYEAGRAVVFTARQAERLREAVGRLDEGDGAGARASVSECLGAVSS